LIGLLVATPDSVSAFWSGRMGATDSAVAWLFHIWGAAVAAFPFQWHQPRSICVSAINSSSRSISNRSPQDLFEGK
jgi:hypothetical protein